VERLHRLRLPAGAIEREHQPAVRALAERVLVKEPPQLDHGRLVLAQLEFRVHQGLDRRHPQLLEPLRGREGERLVRDVGERRAAPEPERLPEQPCRPPRLGRRRLRGQSLEAGEVEPVGRERQHVAGRPRLDRRRRAERPPQLRHLPLHLRHRCHRRPSRVELVGEPLDRHDAIGVQQQDRERRPLPRPAERHLPAVGGHLERTEDAELQHARGR
jgi:hypothetical protein